MATASPIMRRVARYTEPMPPAPILASMRYLPAIVALSSESGETAVTVDCCLPVDDCSVISLPISVPHSEQKRASAVEVLHSGQIISDWVNIPGHQSRATACLTLAQVIEITEIE